MGDADPAGAAPGTAATATHDCEVCMTETRLTDMARDEFLARVHASWARWLATIDGLTDDQLQAPGTCSEWSVKDLIGHVATWDGIAIDKVHGIRAGADRVAVNEPVDV